MRCLVCRSSLKEYYEKLRDEGMSIPKIYDECIKIGERFSEQSLYRHFQNHYSKEGIKVIPSGFMYRIIVYLFRYAESGLVLNKVVPLCKKYLTKPYYRSQKEIYKDLYNICKEVNYVDILDAEWEHILDTKIYEQPFKNKTVREILKN